MILFKEDLQESPASGDLIGRYIVTAYCSFCHPLSLGAAYAEPLGTGSTS